MRNKISIEEIETILKSDGYITPKQAAFYLGVKVKTLADYRSKDRLPVFIKRGNAIRYHAPAIIQFIAERNKAKYMPVYDQLLQTALEHGS